MAYPRWPVSSEAQAAGSGSWPGPEQGATLRFRPSAWAVGTLSSASYLQHLAGPCASASHNNCERISASVWRAAFRRPLVQPYPHAKGHRVSTD